MLFIDLWVDDILFIDLWVDYILFIDLWVDDILFIDLWVDDILFTDRWVDDFFMSRRLGTIGKLCQWTSLYINMFNDNSSLHSEVSRAMHTQ